LGRWSTLKYQDVLFNEFFHKGDTSEKEKGKVHYARGKKKQNNWGYPLATRGKSPPK